MSTITITSWDDFIENAQNYDDDLVFEAGMIIDCNNSSIDINVNVSAKSVDFNGCKIRNLIIPEADIVEGVAHPNRLFKLTHDGSGDEVYSLKNLILENCSIGNGSELILSSATSCDIYIEGLMGYITGMYMSMFRSNGTSTSAEISKSAFTLHFNQQSGSVTYPFNTLFGNVALTDTVFTFKDNNSYAPSNLNLFYYDVAVKYCYFETVGGTFPFTWTNNGYFEIGANSGNNFFNCDVSDTCQIEFDIQNGIQGPWLFNISKNQGSIGTGNIIHKLTSEELKNEATVLATGFDIWPKLAS